MMARAIVVTDDGKEVGEVEIFALSKPGKGSYLGFDGIALTKHWLEAKRLDELDAQKREYAEELENEHRKIERTFAP